MEFCKIIPRSLYFYIIIINLQEKDASGRDVIFTLEVASHDIQIAKTVSTLFPCDILSWLSVIFYVLNLINTLIIRLIFYLIVGLEGLKVKANLAPLS